jgi:hypothetical protein
MKAPKLLLAGLVALSAASMASAQTVIHITGSTAFRKATMVSIEHLMPGYTASWYSNSASITSELNANIALISGTMDTNGSVIFKCSWSGSVGGVQTETQNLPVSTWLTNTTAAGVTTTPVYDPPAASDVNMSDSFQNSSGFNTPPLTAQKVGIIVFDWVASRDWPAGAGTNMTTLLAQALLSGGLPLSQFTGVSTDTTPVYAVGRNFDSGTRLDALAESGYGIFSSVQQVQPIANGSAGGSTITNLDLYPAETVLGLPFSIGQSGFSGGGGVASTLGWVGSTNATSTNGLTPGFIIGYVGRSDAASAVGNGAKYMTWNGQVDTDVNVQEGRYTFWSYEFLDYRSTYANPGKGIANRLAAQIKNVDAGNSGLLLSGMHVSRPVEGGLVTHN